MDIVPAKRRSVVESKRDKNAAISSNGVHKYEESAENTFSQEFTELQEKPSSQSHKSVTISRARGSSHSTSVIDTSLTRSSFGTGVGDISIAKFQNKIDTSAKLIINSDGKVHLDKLYRCAFLDCNYVRGNNQEFLAHLSIHEFGGNYQCYHCPQIFKMPVELKDHIKIHQKCRYFCFYCDNMSVHNFQMCEHLNINHSCKLTTTLPLNGNNYNLFVVCPRNADLDEFNKRLIQRAGHLKANQRKFLSEQQPIQTPINPDEHNFDEMQNLAASSNSTNGVAETTSQAVDQGLGKFVPVADRYRCFARSCIYKNYTSELLQRHIVALHSKENAFTCPHCGEDLGANSTCKEILIHLRYHGSRIHKCPSCLFIHYIKQQVDEHIADSHPNERKHTITLDRPPKN